MPAIVSTPDGPLFPVILLKTGSTDGLLFVMPYFLPVKMISLVSRELVRAGSG